MKRYDIELAPECAPAATIEVESTDGEWVKWEDVQAITVHEQERLRCTNACMALYQSTSVKDISSATSEMQMCWAAGRRIQAKLYPEES